MSKYILVFFLALTLSLTFVSCGNSGEKDMNEEASQTPEYSPPEEPYVMDKNPHLIIETDMGDMEMELFLKESPMTASNFLYLVREGFYDGLIWHRVIPDFVIQTGDPTGTGMGGPGYTIDFEVNDKKHVPGAVAMARSRDPNSAGSQFYIALTALPQLDAGGYCVFGVLASGLEAAKKIAAVETDSRDKPLEPVHLTRIYEKNAFTQ